MKFCNAISALSLVTTVFVSSAYAADLVIYTDGDYPPAYKNTDAGLTGTLVDLLDEAAGNAGLELDYRVQPFKRTVIETKNNSNSCNLALWRTAEREAEYAWVDLAVTDGFALYSLAGANLTVSSLEDSFGYKTGATRGWVSTEALAEAGHPNLDLSNANDGIVRKLKNKRIDLWLSGIISTPMVAEEAGTEVEHVYTVSEVDLALGCNLDSDSELLARLQAAVTAMVESGRAAEIAPAIFSS